MSQPLAPQPLAPQTVFVNARLLDPASGLDAPGGLLVEGDRIVDFGPGLYETSRPALAEAIDCEGHCLAPGLVDMRVTIGEPGNEHKESLASAARAAAAGGITTLACLPNTDPPIDDVPALEFIARRAREAKAAKVHAYACATKGAQGTAMTEMGHLARAGAVGFTDGDHAVADASVLLRLMQYAKVFGRVIVQHPEEPSLASGGHMNSGELAFRLGLSGVPAEAEVILLERDLRLVEMTGARYHAAHLSTALAVEAVRRAKRRGLPVTCDTAPPYFLMTETDVGDYRTFTKLSPPLRGEMDRRAVLEGLADGTVDAIASDHRPEDRDSKRVPFAQAAPGMVGLETLLPLALAPFHRGELGLLETVARLTANPADILGLPAGRLEKGAAADLVLFDLDRPGKIDAGAFLSKSRNTPFDGHPVSGAVLKTYVDGRLVHGERELVHG